MLDSAFFSTMAAHRQILEYMLRYASTDEVRVLGPVHLGGHHLRREPKRQ